MTFAGHSLCRSIQNTYAVGTNRALPHMTFSTDALHRSGAPNLRSHNGRTKSRPDGMSCHSIVNTAESIHRHCKGSASHRSFHPNLIKVMLSRSSVLARAGLEARCAGVP